MVYTNLVRRTSSRLLSFPACQPQQQALVTASAQHSTAIARPISSLASPTIVTNSFAESSNIYKNKTSITTTSRSKHSSTQIKRLFKQNPAKRRIALKEQRGSTDEGVIPESTISPLATAAPKFLTNGWSAPVGGGDGEAAAAATTTIDEYPFQIARTKNKPNNALGFLPVYSEHRKDGARVTTRIKKVSGDREIFLNELRAALQIPIPKNPRDDTIRIRTGGTIEIKGNRVQEVKTWLASLGF